MWFARHVAITVFLVQPANSFVNGFSLPPSQVCAPAPKHYLKGSDKDDDGDDDDYFRSESVDPKDFIAPPMMTFGLNSGRSSPSQRLAVGKSKASSATVHICTNCASEFVNWFGRCPTCKEWGTVQEMRVGRSIGDSANSGVNSSNTVSSRSGGTGGSNRNSPRPIFNADAFDGDGIFSSRDSYRGRSSRPWVEEVGDPVPVTEIYQNSQSWSIDRLVVPDDDEINNVLGGGIVPGSITLLGGDPGVGKSTLLLQIAGAIADLSTTPRGVGMGLDETNKNGSPHQGPVIYCSGEETTAQVASRAARLGIRTPELHLLSDNDADRIAETVVGYFDRNFYHKEGDSEVQPQYPPCLLVIDSIQTMSCESGGASAAGVGKQVRECCGLFMRLAKSLSLPVILIGHVTKQGGVAGPRTIEHMVDGVLYLEGNGLDDGGTASIRMLRAAKNRFGSAEEVGVYSMNSDSFGGREGKLVPVSDPSSLFLSSRMDEEDIDGCAVCVLLEGLRPMTIEVQALVVGCGTSGFAGRRVADGIATPRLLLILAVLQKRCGIRFNKMDVYINVVSGLRVNTGYGKRQGSESDLAVAVALVSSLTGIAVRADCCFVGEIGLLGELRQVGAVEKRVKEARRMGFSRVITPRRAPSARARRKGWNSRNPNKARQIQGIEWIECSTILSALNNGLVSKLDLKGKSSNRKRSWGDKSTSRSSSKHLDVIIDDDTDVDD